MTEKKNRSEINRLHSYAWFVEKKKQKKQVVP